MNFLTPFESLLSSPLLIHLMGTALVAPLTSLFRNLPSPAPPSLLLLQLSHFFLSIYRCQHIGFIYLLTVVIICLLPLEYKLSEDKGLCFVHK